MMQIVRVPYPAKTGGTAARAGKGTKTLISGRGMATETVSVLGLMDAVMHLVRG